MPTHDRDDTHRCSCANCGQVYDKQLTEDYEDRKGNRLCSWDCWEEWMAQPSLPFPTRVNGAHVLH